MKNPTGFPISPRRSLELAAAFSAAIREERLRAQLADAVESFNDEPPIGAAAELEALHRIERLREELAQVTRPTLTRF